MIHLVSGVEIELVGYIGRQSITNLVKVFKLRNCPVSVNGSMKINEDDEDGDDDEDACSCLLAGGKW